MEQGIPKNLKENLDDFFKSCNKRFEKEDNLFQQRKNRIIQESKNRNYDLIQYKSGEQPRLINITHGTAVASILAIYHLGHNFNSAFFISSLIFAAASYIIWLYHEKWGFKAMQLLFDQQTIALDMEDEQNNLKNLSGLSADHRKIIGNSLDDKNAHLFEENDFTKGDVINMFQNILAGAKNNQNKEVISSERLKKYWIILLKYSALRTIVLRLLNKWYFNFIIPLSIAWLMGGLGLIYSFFAASSYLSIQISQLAGSVIIFISITASIFLVCPILKAHKRLKIKSQEILKLIKKLENIHRHKTFKNTVLENNLLFDPTNKIIK